MALLSRRTDGGGDVGGRRVKCTKVFPGAPGRLKAFFDRTAERGITLPNEQAQSRGISLCSGCIVAAAACLAQPVCSLWGPGAQCLHSYSQNIFSSSLNSPYVSVAGLQCSGPRRCGECSGGGELPRRSRYLHTALYFIGAPFERAVARIINQLAALG